MNERLRANNMEASCIVPLSLEGDKGSRRIYTLLKDVKALYSKKKKHQVSSSKYGLRAVFQVVLQGGQPAPPLRFPLSSSLCCRSTTISSFHKHASSSVFFSPFASLRVSLCVPSSGVLGSVQSENVFTFWMSNTQTHFGNTYTFLF